MRFFWFSLTCTVLTADSFLTKSAGPWMPSNLLFQTKISTCQLLVLQVTLICPSKCQLHSHKPLHGSFCYTIWCKWFLSGLSMRTYFWVFFFIWLVFVRAFVNPIVVEILIDLQKKMILTLYSFFLGNGTSLILPLLSCL